MNSWLIRWLVNTVAVALAIELTGMHASGWLPIVATALLLGVINAFIRPIILLLSAPFILASLGLFILVVNALLFWLAADLVGVKVGSFWTAFFGALIVSVVNWVFSVFTRGPEGRIQVVTGRASMVAPAEKTVRGRVVE